MLKISFVALVIVLFSGCGSIRTQTLSPSQYSSYPVLYEVNYDLTCSYGRDLVFKQGDKFGPRVIKNSTLKVYKNYTMGLPYKIPDNALILHIDTTLGNELFALIYPNGEFVADFNFIAFQDGEFVSMFSNTCKLIDGKPLFKQVKNPR